MLQSTNTKCRRSASLGTNFQNLQMLVKNSTAVKDGRSLKWVEELGEESHIPPASFPSLCDVLLLEV